MAAASGITQLANGSTIWVNCHRLLRLLRGLTSVIADNDHHASARLHLRLATCTRKDVLERNFLDDRLGHLGRQRGDGIT